MKTFRLIGFALSAIVFCITACKNDVEELPIHETEIKLTCKVTPSRVTSLDYQSTQIVEGQRVGVTITDAQNEHNNVAWTVGTDGALNNTGSPIYWGEDQVTITAYHPYKSTWTDNEFSVSTDQSTDAGYLSSDLLWTSTTASIIDAPVPLNFTHKLAKINVTITSEDIEDLSNVTICICGTNIFTGFNPTTGALSNVEGTIADIKAGVTTDRAYTSSAIIVPQTVEKGTKFIKLTHGNKNYYYTLPQKMEYQSGHSYNYTLKIDNSNIENPVEGEESEW